MRNIHVSTLAILCVSAVALAAGSDSIPAAGGPITITPISHATLELAHGNHVILVDPTGEGSSAGRPAPTTILLTDNHPDHLDPAALAKVRTPATKIVAPAVVAETVKDATVLANGETRTVDGISIEAVPMYNLTRGPAPGQVFHTKGRGNGYVLTLGGKRIYIAGDTECVPEMKAVKNIDVAFVPMNLPYTMPASEAAACVKALNPKIVYPYHYKGQDLNEFASALEGTGIDVRLRDWYAK